MSTATTAPAPHHDLLCGSCRYNLRGVPLSTTTGTCPECGTPFDPTVLVGELLPWEQGRYTGWSWAFAATARLATFFPTRLAAYTARPVDWHAAARFRTVVVVLALLPPLVTTALLRDFSSPPRTIIDFPGFNPADVWGTLYLIAHNPWCFSIALLGLATWLAVATGTPGYFFPNPKTPQQSRALTLSQYACAPLAYTPVIYLLAAECFWIVWKCPLFRPDESAQLLRMQFTRLAVFLPSAAAAQFAVWLVAALVLMRRTTQCSWTRIAFAAVAIPAAWMAEALVIFTALLALSSYALLVWSSLGR